MNASIRVDGAYRITPAELSFLVNGAAPGTDDRLLILLGGALDDDTLRHGFRSLAARELAGLGNGTLVVEPRFAAVGIIVAQPDTAMSITAVGDIAAAGSWIVVRGDSRVVVSPVPPGVLVCRFLPPGPSVGSVATSICSSVRAADPGVSLVLNVLSDDGGRQLVVKATDEGGPPLEAALDMFIHG